MTGVLTVSGMMPLSIMLTEATLRLCALCSWIATRSRWSKAWCNHDRYHSLRYKTYTNEYL